MNISFYTGVSGMIAYQSRLDSIAHNMANINTTGYKETTNSFVELLYSQIDTNVEGDHLVGHGSKTDYTDVNFQQGSLNFTGNHTDFALVGEGLFAIEQLDGSTAYTRDGSFIISMLDDVPYLADSTGRFVLDENGERIQLEVDPTTESIDMTQVMDKIGINTFENPFGLMPVGNNAFVETEKSGAPTIASGENVEGTEIVQFALEFSTVEMSDEMVDMMITQKGFTLNSKVVQTADQLQEIINNLR